MKSFLVSDYCEQKRVDRKISWESIPDPASISKLGQHKVVKRVGKRDLVAQYRVTRWGVILRTVYWSEK